MEIAIIKVKNQKKAFECTQKQKQNGKCSGRKQKEKFTKMSSINIHLTTFFCVLSTTEIQEKVRLWAFFPIPYLYIHLCDI